MAPRSRRGLGVRAIIAGGLFAITAAVVPASAVDAPTLQESSVDSGWNLSTKAVAARFDKTLNAVDSGAIVRDLVTNTVVPGSATIQGTNIIWQATGDLAANGTEYEVEFTYRAAGLSAPVAETVFVGPFLVDPDVPIPPVITSPEPLLTQRIQIGGDAAAGTPEMVSGYVAPVGPDQMPVSLFAGTARDAAGPNGDLTATSGVASVKLQFWGPTSIISERPDFTQIVAVDTPGVEESTWSIDVSELDEPLPAGLVTLKVVATDVAGGTSSESIPVQFLSV